MRYVIVLLSLVKIAFSFSEWWENSPLLDFNSENFYDFVGKDKFVILKFYTKWCKFCKLMVPEFDKFYDHVLETRDDVIVARIEADANKEIADYYQITRFPKVVMFYPLSNQINSIYDQERTLEGFSKWLQENTKIQKSYNLKISDEQQIEVRNLSSGQTKTEEKLNSKEEIEVMKEQIKSLTEKLEKTDNIIQNNILNTQIKENLRPMKSKELKMFDIIFIVLMMFVMGSAAIILKRIYSKL